MVDTRVAEWQGRNLVVSRDRMVLYLEQTTMAELGVRCDVSRRNYRGRGYARVEEHLNDPLDSVLSGPRRQFSIDGVVCDAPTGRRRIVLVAHPRRIAEHRP